MATWAEFANDDPELAAFGVERMRCEIGTGPFEGRIVYQATLRPDGSPRVHPVTLWIAAGLLCVSFRATSPKVNEVARDARYALHSSQPWEDHDGDHGEFMARGWLEQISSSHPAVTARPGGELSFALVHYTCSVDEAVATEYTGGGSSPVYRRWTSPSGDATG